MSAYERFAEYYDRLTVDADYKSRGAFFDKIIKQNFPKAELLLDLACGTGSLSMEMSKYGYDIIGVDSSEDMLAAAMQKMPEFAGSVMFLCQTAQNLDLYGTIDACVCSLDSLNHLPDEKALEAAISRVSLFMNPGGVFLFDLNTLHKHRDILADSTFAYEHDDFLCLWRNSFDSKDGSVEILLDFFDRTSGNNYKRYSENFSEQFFDSSLVLSLLKKYSMELLNIYDGDSFTAPQDDSQRLLYTAIKKD